MKRLSDYDEYGQGIPKSKKMGGLGSPVVRVAGYVTQEEFDKMHEDLTKQLKEQTSVLEKILDELKQTKLHLASISDEDVESKDTEE